MQLRLHNYIKHDYCLCVVMHDFTKIETSILLTMLAAHSSCYDRMLTPDESKDCQTIIGELKREIDSRQHTVPKHAGSKIEPMA